MVAGRGGRLGGGGEGGEPGPTRGRACARRPASPPRLSAGPSARARGARRPCALHGVHGGRVPSSPSRAERSENRGPGAAAESPGVQAAPSIAEALARPDPHLRFLSTAWRKPFIKDINSGLPWDERKGPTEKKCMRSLGKCL